MKVFDASSVAQNLSYPTCIELMKRCLGGLADGRNQQIVRTGMGVPKGGLAYMPCYLGTEDSFGAKIISVYPGNSKEGYPSHQGYVLLFEGEHGQAVAIADACAITEIRTASASAAASDLLARKDSHTLALIGAGAQARTHVSAMRCVRRISDITVYDIWPEAAEKFKQEIEAQHGIPVTVCQSPAEAVSDADIICTVARTNDPLLDETMVKPGAHINAVGTCNSRSRDLASALVAKARYYVDQKEACFAGDGNFLIAQSEGVVGEGHIIGAIGDVVNNTAPARLNDADITIFKSLGLAVEDVICADYLYRNC